MKRFLISLVAVFNLSAGFQGELKDIEGNTRSFNELKGRKLTVIDFWATWCVPCVQALPELNKLALEYREKGVRFIGINQDGPRNMSKVAPLVKVMNISYPVLLDINQEWASYFQVTDIPTFIVLDTSDTVVWIHEGFTAGDGSLIKQKIDWLLTVGETR
jgi:thiol-disulfide isomerase/thioredoxin